MVSAMEKKKRTEGARVSWRKPDFADLNKVLRKKVFLRK